MKKLQQFTKYLPSFMKRKSFLVIVLIIGFLYGVKQMHFVDLNALNPQAQTSLTPLDMTGVKEAPQPAEGGADVQEWASNAVRTILTFDAENAGEHFQRALNEYFTPQGRGVFSRALAASGTVKYVTSSCRSERADIDGDAKITAFGTRDDKNIWTVHVPIMLVDKPFGGQCQAASSQSEELGLTIVLLVEQSQGTTNDMKIDGLEMRPRDK